MTEHPEAERSRLHWDGTISAGNVLTAAAMFAAMLVWGLRLEGRVDLQQAVATLHATRLQQIEQKDQTDTREMVSVRETLAKLAAPSARALLMGLREGIYADDQQARALLTAAGLDPDEVLR